jgi:hypothetical protein
VMPVGPGARPVFSFLALFSWEATATSLTWGASWGMLGKCPCVSSLGGWRPISVATTSSEGGAMDESEEVAFAAFDVKPAASRELK